MKRDLRKAYKEYLSLYESGVFKGIYRSDEEQIKEMCKDDLSRSIGRALQVGIALGYKAAKKEV